MKKLEDDVMMETMYWWGIPTFFRCKNDNNIKNCDIGIVGIPHSTGNGTTERDQLLGPRAVRNVSPGLKRVHLEFGINPWEKNILSPTVLGVLSTKTILLEKNFLSLVWQLLHILKIKKEVDKLQ